jgi:DNA-binding PadR family transcriptional regulator
LNLPRKNPADDFFDGHFLDVYVAHRQFVQITVGDDLGTDLTSISVTDISSSMPAHKSASPPSPESFLPLTPAVFHVLLALADGERHGYTIMQEVVENTAGRVKMGPGTLYGTLKRLLGVGLVEESDERPDPEMDDERRRYYRLTDLGQKVVKAEAQRYAGLVREARGKKLIGKLARMAFAGGGQ